MITPGAARRIEPWLLVLVALHSYAIAFILVLAPRWGAAFGGWAAIEPLFFARQGGVFHFVIATAYLVEYFRHGRITLLLLAKTSAVCFLTVATLLYETPWAVPLSAVVDLLMLLAVWWIHRVAGRCAK